MKKTFFSLFAASLVVGLAACNNSDESSTNPDSLSTGTSTDSSVSSASMSTQNYAALADTFTRNSAAGVYLDPRTGKSINIKVDPQTGKRTNATTGEPVWRYVDNRTWWVYGGDNWDTVGTAKMQNNKLMYRGDNDKWETYDQRWKSYDDSMMNNWKMQNNSGSMMDSGSNMSSDSSMSSNNNDPKVKVGKHEVKIKDDDGKVKAEKSGTKVKPEQ